MKFQILIKTRQFATNKEGCGIFELINGAYIQHRGTSQTPVFKNAGQFRRYIQRMLRGET